MTARVGDARRAAWRERQQRRRSKARKGYVLPLLVTWELIETLIEAGQLKAWDSSDKTAVKAASQALLDELAGVTVRDISGR